MNHNPNFINIYGGKSCENITCEHYGCSNSEYYCKKYIGVWPKCGKYTTDYTKYRFPSNSDDK